MAETTYAVAPGELISEWLEDENISQGELARRMGVSAKHVSTVINGAPLSADTAQKLARVTGASTKYWLGLEAQHRADLIRLTEAENLQREDLEFLNDIPCAELRKRGVLAPERSGRAELVQDLMSFFRVGSLFALQESVARPQAAYRQGVKSKPAAVATWLRLGDLEAELQAEVALYDAEKLRSLLPQLRSLILTHASHFGRELVEMLADVGVHLVYVRDLPGTSTYGATRWRNGRPVVQLSLRGKDDGHFWFTLFHELAHVLLHGESREVLINETGVDATAGVELEANEFASNLLIPKEYNERLKPGMSLAAIRSLAAELAITPGVLVGRLQHDKLIPFNTGNGLKQKLGISEDDD